MDSFNHLTQKMTSLKNEKKGKTPGGQVCTRMGDFDSTKQRVTLKKKKKRKTPEGSVCTRMGDFDSVGQAVTEVDSIEQEPLPQSKMFSATRMMSVLATPITVQESKKWVPLESTSGPSTSYLDRGTAIRCDGCEKIIEKGIAYHIYGTEIDFCETCFTLKKHPDTYKATQIALSYYLRDVSSTKDMFKPRLYKHIEQPSMDATPEEKQWLRRALELENVLRLSSEGQILYRDLGYEKATERIRKHVISLTRREKSQPLSIERRRQLLLNAMFILGAKEAASLANYMAGSVSAFPPSQLNVGEKIPPIQLVPLSNEGKEVDLDVLKSSKKTVICAVSGT